MNYEPLNQWTAEPDQRVLGLAIWGLLPCSAGLTASVLLNSHQKTDISKAVNYSSECGIENFFEELYQGLDNIIHSHMRATFSFHFNLLPDFCLVFYTDQQVCTVNQSLSPPLILPIFSVILSRSDFITESDTGYPHDQWQLFSHASNIFKSSYGHQSKERLLPSLWK